MFDRIRVSKNEQMLVYKERKFIENRDQKQIILMEFTELLN